MGLEAFSEGIKLEPKISLRVSLGFRWVVHDVRVDGQLDLLVAEPQDNVPAD